MSILSRFGVAFGFYFMALVSVPQNVFAQQAEAQAPGSSAADDIYFEAQKARLRGDDAREEQLLRDYIKKEPNVAAPYYYLSRLTFKANNLTLSSEYIEKAITLDDKNKYYKEHYAQVLAGRNEYEKAADVYAKLAVTERYNNEYLFLSSRLYQRAKNFKRSLEQIDKLIVKKGSDDDLLVQKQQIYLSMNDVESAAGVIRDLIKRNADEPRYYILLAELFENNKEASKAQAAYDDAEKKFPNDPLVQLSLATHYKKLKQDDKYVGYLKQAITNKELDAETQISILIPYIQDLATDTARRAEGLELVGRIAGQHPNDAQVVAFYGEVLAMNGRREEASEQYKRSISIDASRFNVWQQLLYSYTDRPHADSLIKYSEKAIRVFPNQAQVHFLNGVGHYNKKAYQRAVFAINRAIGLQPEDNAEVLAEMYTTLGDVYNSMKSFTESDSSYERAIRLQPGNATALNNYAYYLSERNSRLEDAERMSKKSLQLRPDEGTYLDTYGWILFQQGKYDKAKEYVQKAVDADPGTTDPTLLEHLGDIYFKMNNVEKAVELWKQSKDKGNDNEKLDKKIQERKLL